MKRTIDWHLRHWKTDPRRKPLILRGARQVGKTFAVRKLGQDFESFIEINFELLHEAKSIFSTDLKPERILWELGLLTKTTIIPGKTLLFLDEVQTTPNVISALRYFYEHTPQLHVIAAGSLIDFAIEKVGMPVGRVNTLYIYPLSFIEFLSATQNGILIEAILKNEPLSEIIHHELLNLLREYLAIGGMPEVVFEWSQSKNPITCRDIQKELIETYRQDFPKYAKKFEIKYVDTLFRQVPHYIGEQFKYSSINGEYKKRELAPGLDLLCHANVVYKITQAAGNGIPIGSETNPEKFKLIYLDVGITQALLGLDLMSWLLNKDLDFINQGIVAESFVGQELLCYASPKWKSDLYYWQRNARNAQAEVDYLVDYQGMVLPIEVKSGPGSTLRSMHQFLLEHPKSTFGVRFSTQNYSNYEKINSKPLYAVANLTTPDQKQALLSLF